MRVKEARLVALHSDLSASVGRSGADQRDAGLQQPPWNISCVGLPYAAVVRMCGERSQTLLTEGTIRVHHSDPEEVRLTSVCWGLKVRFVAFLVSM